MIATIHDVIVRTSPVSVEVVLGIAASIVTILGLGTIPAWRYLKKHVVIPWRALTGIDASDSIDGEGIPSLPKQVKQLRSDVKALHEQGASTALIVNDLARVTLPNGNGSVVETVHRMETKLDSLEVRVTELEKQGVQRRNGHSDTLATPTETPKKAPARKRATPKEKAS